MKDSNQSRIQIQDYDFSQKTKANLEAVGSIRRGETLAGLLENNFLNRTDTIPILPPWGKPYPGKTKDISSVIRAHVMGPMADEAVIETKNGVIRGHFRAGTYMPAVDGLTRVGCIDLDGGRDHEFPLKDPLFTAVEIQHRLTASGVPVYLERSGGGEGFHLWVLFERPVSAAKVRRFLLISCRGEFPLLNGGIADPNSNRGIEVFPKQDRIQPNGFGNMVWLPFWHAANPGTTSFYLIGGKDEN